MATPSTSPALLYRQTALGDALVESLDALITEGKISPDLALKVLAEFDSAFLSALSTKVGGKATFKGKLDTYRFCDSVWTFVLRDAVVKLPAGPGGRPPARETVVERMKVVAVDSRLAAPK